MSLDMKELERDLKLQTGQGKRALKLALEGVMLLDKKQQDSAPTTSSTQVRSASSCDARIKYADSATYWRRVERLRMSQSRTRTRT